jgi:hypothetical protein
MPTLAQLLRASQGAPIEPRAACAIAVQLCSQLEEPHGGLSPSAIQVGWDGAVSLPRAGRPPTAALGYMAPERLAGRAPDQRSDLYALALILFEMVTGRPLPRAVVDGSARCVDADLPVELLDIIERASARDPRDRYAGAREMAAWLSLAEEESGGSMTRSELASWLAIRFGRDGSRPVARPAKASGRWRLGAAVCLVAGAGTLVAVFAAPGLVGAEPSAAMSVDSSRAMAAESSRAMSAMPAEPSRAMATMPAESRPVLRLGSGAKADLLAIETGTESSAPSPQIAAVAAALDGSRALSAEKPSEPARKRARKRKVRAARPEAREAPAVREPAAQESEGCPMRGSSPEAAADDAAGEGATGSADPRLAGR